MNKEEYAVYLLEYMAKMIRKNKEAEGVYRTLQKKAKNCNTYQDMQSFYSSFDDEDNHIWTHCGVFYTKAELRRIRITLAKVLLELERGKN